VTGADGRLGVQKRQPITAKPNGGNGENDKKNKIESGSFV